MTASPAPAFLPPIPTSPPPQLRPALAPLPRVWSQLEPARQHQLAQLLAKLIQRIHSAAPRPKERSDDQS
jgi:hypothetical protein